MRARARTIVALIGALMITSCTSSKPDRSPSSAEHTSTATAGWREITPPQRGARILVLTGLGKDLLALGSVPGRAIQDSSNRAPGAWVTNDLRTWTRIPLHAVTGYGELAEFTWAGVYGGHISAFGHATGGAHGNPRPTIWTGTRAGLVEHVQSFTMFGGAEAISQTGESAGPGGSLIVGQWEGRTGYGATVWTSRSGAEWVRHQDTAGLAPAKGEQTTARGAAPLGTGFLVVGDTQPAADGQRALAWTSADPRRWTRTPLPSPSGAAATAARASCAGTSCVVVGVRTTASQRLLCWTLSRPGAAPHLGTLGPSGGLLEPDQLLAAGRSLYAVVDTDSSARLVAVDRGCGGWRSIPLPARTADAAVGLLGNRMLLATTARTVSRVWVADAP